MANAGCLLSDPINEPPAVKPIEGPSAIFRNSGGTFNVQADTRSLQWGWITGPCPANLAAQPRSVLGAPQFYNVASVAIKMQPVGFLCVWVLATDSDGAETLVWKDVEVKNQLPTPTISIAGTAPKSASVVPLYQEIKITGAASDPDGDPLTSFVWTVTLPDGSTIPGKPCATPEDGRVLCFVPPTSGTYEVKLVVKDSIGDASAPASTIVEVRPDQLPCLRDTEGGRTGTLLRRWDEDVAFTVAVDDDGDPFPPREGQMSAVNFVWLFRKKEAGKQTQMVRVTDYNQASLRLPAQSFVQGDEIEVRVEVMDRNAVPVTCAESEALCLKPSANAPSGGAGTSSSALQCPQRLTWTVRYVL